MIRIWANIAKKLGITQENALLLHALIRGWLDIKNVIIARRKAQIVVDDIVERFELDDNDFGSSYARQLLAKGILNPTEAEVLLGNYHEDNSGTGEARANSEERGRPVHSGGNSGTGPASGPAED